MISAKEAVQKAADYLKSLVQLPMGTGPSLEEIELAEPDWYVTLSYTPVTANAFGVGFGGAIGGKEYKIFKIRGEDGEILSMKIRTFK